MGLNKGREGMGKRTQSIANVKKNLKAHVGAHNLQHAAVNVLVRDAFDVAISNLLVPDLQRFGSVSKVQPRHVSRIQMLQTHTQCYTKLTKTPIGTCS